MTSDDDSTNAEGEVPGDNAPKVRYRGADGEWHNLEAKPEETGDPDLDDLRDMTISDLDAILDDEEHPLHEKARQVSTETMRPLSEAAARMARPALEQYRKNLGAFGNFDKVIEGYKPSWIAALQPLGGGIAQKNLAGAFAQSQIAGAFTTPVIQGMLDAIKPLSAQSQIAGAFTTPAIQGMLDAIKPLSAQSQIAGAFTTPAIQGALDAISAGMATQGILNQFRLDYLQSYGPAFQELLEEVSSTVDEETLEDFDETAVSGGDPVLEACLIFATRYGAWARDQFPEYSDRAIDGLNKFAAVVTRLFIAQLPAALLTFFGLPGLVIGLLLGGGAELVDKDRKKLLAPQIRNGIDRACTTCAAIPGMWCITTRGTDPGSRAKTLHKPRLTSDDDKFHT